MKHFRDWLLALAALVLLLPFLASPVQAQCEVTNLRWVGGNENICPDPAHRAEGYFAWNIPAGCPSQYALVVRMMAPTEQRCTEYYGIGDQYPDSGTCSPFQVAGVFLAGCYRFGVVLMDGGWPVTDTVWTDIHIYHHQTIQPAINSPRDCEYLGQALYFDWGDALSEPWRAYRFHYHVTDAHGATAADGDVFSDDSCRTSYRAPGNYTANDLGTWQLTMTAYPPCGDPGVPHITNFEVHDREAPILATMGSELVWDSLYTFSWTRNSEACPDSFFRCELWKDGGSYYYGLFYTTYPDTSFTFSFPAADSGHYNWSVQSYHRNIDGVREYTFGMMQDFNVVNPVYYPVAPGYPPSGIHVTGSYPMHYAVQQIPGQPGTQYVFQFDRSPLFNTTDLRETPPSSNNWVNQDLPYSFTQSNTWYWRARAQRLPRIGEFFSPPREIVLDYGPTITDLSAGGQFEQGLFRFELMAHGEPVGPATDPVTVELQYRLLPNGGWNIVAASQIDPVYQVWYADVDLEFGNNDAVEYVWYAVNQYGGESLSPVGADWHDPDNGPKHHINYPEVDLCQWQWPTILLAPLQFSQDLFIPNGERVVILADPGRDVCDVLMDPGVRIVLEGSDAVLTILGTAGHPIEFRCSDPSQTWGPIELSGGLYYAQHARFADGPVEFIANSPSARMTYCHFEPSCGPIVFNYEEAGRSYLYHSEFLSRNLNQGPSLTIVNAALRMDSITVQCEGGIGMYLRDAGESSLKNSDIHHCTYAGLVSEGRNELVTFFCNRFEYNNGEEEEITDAGGLLNFSESYCTFRDVRGWLYRITDDVNITLKFLEGHCNFFIDDPQDAYYIFCDTPTPWEPLNVTGNYWCFGFDYAYLNPGDIGYFFSDWELWQPSECSEAQPQPGAQPLAAETKAEVTLPTQYALLQNYPNPFNPETTIRFDLPAAGPVTLTVLNTLGQRVTTLVDGTLPAGSHRVHWNGRDAGGTPLPSGMYLYQIQAGAFSAVQKMVLLK